MATQTLVKDDPTYVKRLNPLFRVNPVSKKIGGKEFVIEHRIGRDVGCFTVIDAMQKTGTHEQWKKECLSMRKKFGADTEGYEKYAESIFARYKEQMRRMFSDYRGWLERYYEVQGLLPRMAWVPVSGKSDENVIFIQAMIDRHTRKLVLGEQEDYALYFWATAKHNKKSHDIYEENIADVKAALPQFGKEFAHCLKQLVGGEIPQSPYLIGYDKK